MYHMALCFKMMYLPIIIVRTCFRKNYYMYIVNINHGVEKINVVK